MLVPICTIVQNFRSIGVTVAEISVTVQKTYLKLDSRQSAYTSVVFVDNKTSKLSTLLY